MKAKWEIVLSLGGLFALLMWAKPHLDARPESQSEDVVIQTMQSLQTQTISGPSLILAFTIVAAFGWRSITQEQKYNSCLGPLLSVGLGGIALWLLYML